MSSQLGTLWGVSVGPGDAEWLTLKGLRVLQSVSAIACPQDRQGNPGMAYGIVRSYLSDNQTILPLELPFVTDSDQLISAWQRAAERVLNVLNEGEDVGFIAEGDVSFYSTFTHLASTVRRQSPQVPIEAIPGVCSPLAAVAALRMPLSMWDERVAVLPAMYCSEDLEQALQWAEVVVLMKVASVFETVWSLLDAYGLLQSASLVEWVGGGRQTIHPSIETLKDYRPPYFSILIVRKQTYCFAG